MTTLIQSLWWMWKRTRMFSPNDRYGQFCSAIASGRIPASMAKEVGIDSRCTADLDPSDLDA